MTDSEPTKDGVRVDLVEAKPVRAKPVAVRTGRKPWVPLNLTEVEGLARRGLTQEQIAYSLGIAPSTLYAKKKAFSEFSEAIKRGQAKGITAVASKIYEDALAGNTVAGIFYLKARGKWRDQHLELSTDVDERLAEAERIREETLKYIRALTPEEREIYLKLVTAAKERVMARIKSERNGETIVVKARRVMPPLPPEIAMLEVREDVGTDGAEAEDEDLREPES
jgi:hypothetical protein